MQIAISNIKIPAGQIRINPGNLQELAENIKKYGILHPIVVNEQFELIAGYRRLKAAESLGWTEVPATIISSTPTATQLTSLTEYDLHLSENIQRKELSALELSDALLERKQRFEQIYGSIKHGGDRTNNISEESKLATCQLAPPDFYTETSQLCKLSESTIYRFLRLQELDADLKQKVYTREVNYANALSEQAERNQALKNQNKKPKKSGFRICGIPDQHTAELYTTLFNKAPKLFQLFQLVNHSWQTIRQLIEYQNECDQLDLEILHNFIVQLGELMSFYQTLFTHLQHTQEQKLNPGIEIK